MPAVSSVTLPPTTDSVPQARKFARTWFRWLIDADRREDDPMVKLRAPKAPAHPWKKALRTAIATALMLGGIAPQIYQAATQGNPEAATGWAATGLVIAGAVTRIMALPTVNRLLRRVGLGHDDVEASRVLVATTPAGRAVAGDASPLRTGSRLQPHTTIGSVTGKT